MNDFTEHNLDLLERHPHLINLPPEIPAGRVEILESRSPGNPTLVAHLPQRDVFIHSKFDPEHEARRWAKQQEVNDSARFLLVFGLGLGYHIEALLEEYPEIKKFYVFEVSSDIFRAALAARDLTALLGSGRVCLIVGSYSDIHDSVEKFLMSFSQDSNGVSNAEVVIHRPSLEVFPEDSEELRDILEYLKLASSKKSVFEKEHESNKAANKAVFEAARGVNELFNSYEGRRLIVAAAGPSLDISIGILKAASAAPDIIAVDSALAPLHHAGIHPRYVITGDPQEKTADLFRGLDIQDEELIFFPSSNPEIVSLFAPERRHAACASILDDEKLLDEIFNKGQLFFSGTIFLAAVDFAVKTGAKPVVMIGADFAFLDDQTHATSSRTQGYSPRFGRIREVMGLHDTTVKTSDILYLYMKELERYYLNLNDPNRLFNATARGATVFHIPYIDFGRFLSSGS